MKRLTFDPDWSSPPGDSIKDCLKERHWSKQYFGSAMGYTEKEVNDLLSGKTKITEKIAKLLALHCGSTIEFWERRESQYRKSLQRTKTKKQFNKERENNRPNGCINMTISSLVPSKWRFVDLETGHVWTWKDGTFKQASEKELEELAEILENQ